MMTSLWRQCGWLLLGSSLILALSLGVRHGFGLFLAPMSAEFGWGREVFAFAIALQNLVWGLIQPFTGAFADRYGVKRTVVIGGILYVAGKPNVARKGTRLSSRKSALCGSDERQADLVSRRGPTGSSPAGAPAEGTKTRPPH